MYVSLASLLPTKLVLMVHPTLLSVFISLINKIFCVASLINQIFCVLPKVFCLSYLQSYFGLFIRHIYLQNIISKCNMCTLTIFKKFSIMAASASYKG